MREVPASYTVDGFHHHFVERSTLAHHATKELRNRLGCYESPREPAAMPYLSPIYVERIGKHRAVCTKPSQALGHVDAPLRQCYLSSSACSILRTKRC